jgi:hypothetical protein
MGTAGIKTSEFLAMFFAFAVVALSGLDIAAGVIDYHLDLTAALGALTASTAYGGFRTLLKHKAASAPAAEPPTAEDVAKQVLSSLQQQKAA